MSSTVSKVQPVYDLAAFREAFDVTHQGITYLNHAGMSPLHHDVKQAMIDAVEMMSLQGSGVYDELAPMREELLIRLAKLVGASPQEIAFVENTSAGINLIANGMPLNDGENVLLCDLEFPSNVYPWQLLEAKGVETRLFPAKDGGLSIEELDKARDDKSRVVAVSAIQFFSGRKEDLVELGQYCADHDLWLVVDAMQAVGIMPIDMQAMGIHALACGGQKSMMAASGQGFMAIRADLIEQMVPVFVGPVSVIEHERWLDYNLTLKPQARRFDMATANLVGLAALHAAAGVFLELGVKNINQWVTHLSKITIDDLAGRGYKFATPTDPAYHAHIVTFRWDGDPAEAVSHLKEDGIIIRAHLDKEGRDYLRISTHGYNTESDVLRVGQSLEKIRS